MLNLSKKSSSSMEVLPTKVGNLYLGLVPPMEKRVRSGTCIDVPRLDLPPRPNFELPFSAKF